MSSTASLARPLMTIALVTACGAPACGAPAPVMSAPPASVAPASVIPASSSRWASGVESGWSEMQRALVGRWSATTPDNREVEVSYRLVSNGSALVETYRSASGKETLSVYHRDGDSLMLTHYCGQGNQPRLKAVALDRERVELAYLDATNVDRTQSVMHRLVIAWRADGLDREEIYEQPGEAPERTTLHFSRRP